MSTIQEPSPIRFREFSASDVQLRYLGSERHPVVVIDDALEDPQGARALALRSRYFRPEVSAYYPGYEGSCGAPGLSAGVQWIARYFWNELYGLSEALCPAGWDDVGKVFFACFAPRVDLKYVNVHVDGLSKLAVVLHLSPDDLETGTAFWRDQATGLQSFFPEEGVVVEQAEALLGLTFSEDLRRALAATPGATRRSLLRSLMGERMIHPPFPDHDHAGWELLDRVPSRFNRLVVYPGWQFHSVYHPSYEPGGSIERARLTMNTFLSLPTPESDRRVPASRVAGMQL